MLAFWIIVSGLLSPLDACGLSWSLRIETHVRLEVELDALALRELQSGDSERAMPPRWDDKEILSAYLRGDLERSFVFTRCKIRRYCAVTSKKTL